MVRNRPRICLAWVFAFAVSLGLGTGCRRTTAPPEPEAKVRLARLLRLYTVYVEKHHKGPPNEEALRTFGQKLTAKERDEYLIGDDLDKIFTSPRDQKKYEVSYNLRLDPGQPRAVAWEATTQKGKRFVALSLGYVEEYDDETFQQYR